MSESELLDILRATHNKLASGVYLLDCVCLNGMKCRIAIHFSGSNGDRLGKLELFPTEIEDFHSGFDQMQAHLESVFGPPDMAEVGYHGFSNFAWTVDEVRVTHLVVDALHDIEQMVTIARPQRNP